MSQNFKFTFRALPLSAASRAQLAGIQESVEASGRIPATRRGLLNMIAENAYVPNQKNYVPVRAEKCILGMLPASLLRVNAGIHAATATFFSNPLEIPEGFGLPDFDPQNAAPPKTRLTNAGFVTVTLEMDCETPGQIDENLEWTRDSDGKNGLLTRVDAELSKYKDYRGFSAVYSGRRSIHYHFVFSIAHLEAAPPNAGETTQLGLKQLNYSAILASAHNSYWDYVRTCFEQIEGRPLQFDTTMRSWLQWRRTPWAMRRLEKDFPPLGLKAGMLIPQVVVRENIRSRAAPQSDDFLVARNFSLPEQRARSSSTSTRRSSAAAATSDEALRLLQNMCAEEWEMEYPKPVSVLLQNGEHLIHFQNHADDINPSTVALGEYRMLQLNGRHPFGSRRFFLPGHMSANELIEHLSSEDENSPHFEACPRNPALSVDRHPLVFGLEEEFRSTVLTGPPVEQRSAVRRSLGETISYLRMLAAGQNDILLESVEGVGKTSSFQRELAGEIFDDAMAADQHGGMSFACFAFRSLEQAQAKAAEYCSRYGGGVVIKGLWRIYEEACAATGGRALYRTELQTSSRGPLGEIKRRQPMVFDAMEAVRKSLWSQRGPFDSGRTILFMSHASAMRWHHSRITRIWAHPRFDPEAPLAEQAHLRDDFRLSKVVFDEPDVDEILHRFSQKEYEALLSSQENHPRWRHLLRSERQGIYMQLRAEGAVPASSFEAFDERMRLDLTKLEPVQVDPDRIPFGRQHGPFDMYAKQRNYVFYLGVQQWIFDAGCRWAFLTTEDFVSNVIESSYARAGRKSLLIRCDLDEVSGIYPVPVPLFLDKRASKRRISELVQEIAAARPNAKIIADVVKGSSVTNFITMKGSNDFQHDDVFIIPMFPSDHLYALLNVTGIFIGSDDVISMYYADQLNQAVGRNRGFRESDRRSTATVVVASPSFSKAVLRGLTQTRVELRQTERKPWEGPAQ
ncbi:hypothetical protein [Methylobacterium nigriterrae]|uniref:hypothetical protein n=1 Tax=Methylobacterium nigriterrae TaxID=3127512 RepID=UPI0030134939